MIDYFIPVKDEEFELPSATLSDEESLNWFYQKYLNTVKIGKPNFRNGELLKKIIDIINVRYQAKLMEESKILVTNSNVSHKITFKIPVGDIPKEEQESLLEKIKNIIK